MTDATTAHTKAAKAVTDSEKAKADCDSANKVKNKKICDKLTDKEASDAATVAKFTAYKAADTSATDAYNTDRQATESHPVDSTSEASTAHAPADWAKWESGSLTGADQNLTAVHAIAHTNSSDEASHLTAWTKAFNTWNNDGTKAVKADAAKHITAKDATYKCDDTKLTADQKKAKDTCDKWETAMEDAAANYHQSRANLA